MRMPIWMHNSIIKLKKFIGAMMVGFGDLQDIPNKSWLILFVIMLAIAAFLI